MSGHRRDQFRLGDRDRQCPVEDGPARASSDLVTGCAGRDRRLGRASGSAASVSATLKSMRCWGKPGRRWIRWLPPSPRVGARAGGSRPKKMTILPLSTPIHAIKPSSRTSRPRWRSSWPGSGRSRNRCYCRPAKLIRVSKSSAGRPCEYGTQASNHRRTRRDRHYDDDGCDRPERFQRLAVAPPGRPVLVAAEVLSPGNGSDLGQAAGLWSRPRLSAICSGADGVDRIRFRCDRHRRCRLEQDAAQHRADEFHRRPDGPAYRGRFFPWLAVGCTQAGRAIRHPDSRLDHAHVYAVACLCDFA